MIIGLTGRNAGGKGTVAAFFQENGFAYTSLSDAIRTYLAQQGLQPTRDQMIATARSARACCSTCRIPGRFVWTTTSTSTRPCAAHRAAVACPTRSPVPSP